MQDTPDYLDYNAQGYCDITMDRPVTLSKGIEQEHIRMREPTVDDQILHDEMKGSQAVKEVATMAACRRPTKVFCPEGK